MVFVAQLLFDAGGLAFEGLLRRLLFPARCLEFCGQPGDGLPPFVLARRQRLLVLGAQPFEPLLGLLAPARFFILSPLIRFDPLPLGGQ